MADPFLFSKYQGVVSFRNGYAAFYAAFLICLLKASAAKIK